MEQYRCPNCNYHDERVQLEETAPETDGAALAPDATEETEEGQDSAPSENADQTEARFTLKSAPAAETPSDEKQAEPKQDEAA